MSNLIHLESHVNNAPVLCDTLTSMNIGYTVHGDNVKISSHRYPITFNTKTGHISCDSDMMKDVNKIKQNYTLKIYRRQAILEGNQMHQEVQANGEIVVYFS